MTANKIYVTKYDPRWALEFQELKRLFAEKLGDLILKIEHVGSTSVPGLAAKPILDIDIIITDDLELQQKVISELEKIGYKHLGDLGITGREAFQRRNDKVPFTGNGRQWMKHHLYLCRVGSIGLQNHLLFRDYLRKASLEKEKYSKLKQELATRFPDDIDAYIDGKTDFIIDILKRAGLDLKTANLIAAENKQTKSSGRA